MANTPIVDPSLDQSQGGWNGSWLNIPGLLPVNIGSPNPYPVPFQQPRAMPSQAAQSPQGYSHDYSGGAGAPSGGHIYGPTNDGTFAGIDGNPGSTGNRYADITGNSLNIGSGINNPIGQYNGSYSGIGGGDFFGNLLGGIQSATGQLDKNGNIPSTDSTFSSGNQNGLGHALLGIAAGQLPGGSLAMAALNGYNSYQDNYDAARNGVMPSDWNRSFLGKLFNPASWLGGSMGTSAGQADGYYPNAPILSPSASASDVPGAAGADAFAPDVNQTDLQSQQRAIYTGSPQGILDSYYGADRFAGGINGKLNDDLINGKGVFAPGSPYWQAVAAQTAQTDFGGGSDSGGGGQFAGGYAAPAFSTNTSGWDGGYGGTRLIDPSVSPQGS